MIFNLLSYIGDETGTMYALITLLLRIPAILLALSIHEAAHGWIANKLGDPTAKNLGRITLNPLKHIHPIGALSMLIFGVGWANPVPINTRYFKKPKRDMALTAIAGPISNLLQALIGTFAMFIGMRLYFGRQSADVALSISDTGCYGTFLNMIFNGESVDKVVGLLLYLCYIYATLNFVLALFNMIPIPPFDGSRLAFAFLPDKFYFGIMRYERFIMIGFLILFYLFGGIFDLIFSIFINLVFSSCFWILIL